MTQDELLKRRPVWEAMADLFLDTETRWSVPNVAQRCAESGYDDEQLERIFWGEVFPQAIGNLKGVAGEWFVLELDEQALIKRANHHSIPWLARRAHGWMVQSEWLAARTVTEWLRPLNSEERILRAQVLNLLGRRFFEEPAAESFVGSAARLKEVQAIAREEWKRYEPVCRSMLGDESSMPADECAAAVAKLLA